MFKFYNSVTSSLQLWIFGHDKFIDLPLHTELLRVNPGMHLQLKLPWVLEQISESPHGEEMQSSTSR